MAAGTVVHSPRPGMQLRKRIAVAGRRGSNADYLSWLCHEERGYDSTGTPEGTDLPYCQVPSLDESGA